MFGQTANYWYLCDYFGDSNYIIRAQIHIYGHSSSRTKNTTISRHKEINFNTSLKRAKAVATALRNAGVKKGNITIEAMSDLHPLFSEAMPEGERQNRRAEIYVSY